MRSDELDERMRKGEYFHGLRVLQGTYVVVRVDGRSFSRLTERVCEKPFDLGFHRKMTEAAKAIVVSLHGTYAHTQSDEISVLLPLSSSLFDREVGLEVDDELPMKEAYGKLVRQFLKEETDG